MKTQVWLMSLVLVTAVGTSLATNIVVDGGFETPVVPSPPGYQQVLTTFSEWGVERDGGYLIDKAFRPNIPEGNQCFQLVGLVDGAGADIYQLFSGLTPGAQYKVRYAQAQRGDVTSILSVLNVQWKSWDGGVYGGTSQVLYEQTTTETEATYTYHEFTITARNENDFIVFLAEAIDVEGVLTNNMPNIDDISVELVPEPATIGLLGAGCVLAALRRRRR